MSLQSLNDLVTKIADILEDIDASRVPHKNYQPGVGPYGERQIVSKIAEELKKNPALAKLVKIKRTPDLLIQGLWALEFKIVRPFGDNGKEAENWSVNLIHPYEGNKSSIGDCYKLRASGLHERKAVIVIGFEHSPPQIPVDRLADCFEIISTNILNIPIGPRSIEKRTNLIHPVHQQFTVYAWEVL